MIDATTEGAPHRSEERDRVVQPLSPFLKWAGGKRWLCKRFSQLFPADYDRYFEPFLGSGAVFFHLRPAVSFLNDANVELVETYRAIASNPALVEKHLLAHSTQHDDQYYYSVRSSRPRSQALQAARVLYLNRTCWNGLYRVNRQGIFNVPRGTKDAVILPDDDFGEVSAALKGATLMNGDFEAALDLATDGDFAFVDPPYTVAHNLNGFIKYNDSIFTWEDQIRLRNSVKSAIDRGAMVLVTNADHASVRELYDGVGTQLQLNRPTIISGSSKGRRPTTELAIVGGYKPSNLG